MEYGCERAIVYRGSNYTGIRVDIQATVVDCHPSVRYDSCFGLFA